MELRHLRYFITVAEELHFSRAAERLSMAQPPLSQQIQHLEEELGVLLFQRTKRRVELTQAGVVFLEHARNLLIQLDEAIEITRKIGQGKVGRLEISYVYSVSLELLPSIIEQFLEHYPQVQLELHEKTTLQQIQAVRDRSVQIGFVRGPLIKIAPQNPDLTFEIITREPLVVALPHKHRLATIACVPVPELANERLVIFPRYTNPAHYDEIIQMCQQAGFTPHIAQEVAQLHTILSLVAIGMGIALVPASARAMGRTGVIYRSLATLAPELEVVMVWRKDNFTPVLQTFLETARKAVLAVNTLS